MLRENKLQLYHIWSPINTKILKYKKYIINSAISKAKSIPRVKSLKRVTSNSEDKRRPVFAVLYDPRLPALPSIVKKHWRTMVAGDHHLEEAFPLPPLVAYKRPPNIRDKIIRSKVPETLKRAKRSVPGMSKCNNCPICPFVSECKIVKSTASNHIVEVNKQVNCQTIFIRYCHYFTPFT